MEKKIKNYLLLSAIIILGLAVRLYRVDFPLADWHSWRQVDTAGVTREFVKNGIDLLHPKYMDISSIPSGFSNPQGYRMVEFPFINGLTAWVVQIMKQFGSFNDWTDLVRTERIVSIIFSLGSVLGIYLLVKEILDDKVAMISAAIMAFLPFNIYYSRVVLPEPKMVFFSLFACLFSYRFIQKGKWSDWVFWVITGALATLLKPMWLLIFGPALIWTAVRTRKSGIFSLSWGLMFALGWIAVLVPFFLWRGWIAQFPSGIPASDWLYNAGGLRWRPAWFRWLLADRLGRLILGYWGMIPFGLGIISMSGKKEDWFFHWWLIGGLIYLSVFATGNVTHDYYQAVLVPVIAVIAAKGLYFLWKPPLGISRLMARGLLPIITVLTIGFSWFYVRDYLNINHPEIVEAGLAADKILPVDAKVVVPYGGDTAFLFQTNRLGWPVGGAIEDKISLGATHYISVNFDGETKDLMGKCPSLLKTDQYVIIDLKACK
jgi:hypothetical protein